MKSNYSLPILALGTSLLPLQAGITLNSVNAGAGDFTGIQPGIFADLNVNDNTGTTMVSRQNGSKYEFGLIQTPIGPPSGNFNTAAEFGLAPTSTDSSYTVQFTIDSGEALNYIAYTGSSVEAFDYNASTGIVTMTVSPVMTAISTTNDTSRAMLGMSVSTYDINNPSGIQGGSIFNTDMWWGDVTTLKDESGYGSSNDYLGANFDGQNGENVNFRYYVPMTVLRDNPRCNMESLDDIAFTYQKSTGLTITPSIDITYFTNGATESDPDYIPPEFINAGTNGGASSFSFADNNNGDSNYVLIEASNDSWSDANVTMTRAVPEPSSLAILSLSSLVFMVRRRK